MPIWKSRSFGQGKFFFCWGITGSCIKNRSLKLNNVWEGGGEGAKWQWIFFFYRSHGVEGWGKLRNYWYSRWRGEGRKRQIKLTPQFFFLFTVQQGRTFKRRGERVKKKKPKDRIFFNMLTYLSFKLLRPTGFLFFFLQTKKTCENSEHRAASTVIERLLEDAGCSWVNEQRLHRLWWDALSIFFLFFWFFFFFFAIGRKWSSFYFFSTKKQMGKRFWSEFKKKKNNKIWFQPKLFLLRWGARGPQERGENKFFFVCSSFKGLSPFFQPTVFFFFLWLFFLFFFSKLEQNVNATCSQIIGYIPRLRCPEQREINGRKRIVELE